ncbi:MAG: insulinase family protein, partial [Candidatus Hydrogenedentes bacterium]|nr:insulinase family protein [Candidatus Hydrogenedentota bacterium]
LDEELEFMAAGIETTIGRESGTVDMSVLKKDLRRGVELLAEVLREPAFREDKFELARRSMIEGIRRRYDEPASIANVEFPKLVYGASSPWARTSTIETVNAISRSDLVAFHHKYFVPNNTMMAVSGDFDKKAMATLLEDVFGGWRRRAVTFPDVAPIAERYAPGAYWVQRDGAPQTVIVTGHLGMRRHCPEQIAVETMNNIFGLGGFTSRLMREVRSNRGLAYSVYGYVSPGTDRGLFEVFCQTKAESTIETTRLIRQIVRQMTEQPVPNEELTATKEQLLNKFIFKFESSAALLDERLLRDYLGYAPDYLDTYTGKVRAVSAADVLDAARKYVHPDGMVTLFVGDKTLFDGNIDEFGPVREIKLDRDNGTSYIVP